MKRAAVLADTALYPQAATSPLSNVGNTLRVVYYCSKQCLYAFADGANHVNVNNVFRICGAECMLV